MNYGIKIIKTVRHSFDFNGRSSTEEYWRAVTLFLVVMFIGNIIFNIVGEKSYISLSSLNIYSSIFQIVISLPFYGLSVRRLHDTNRSGWWLLLSITIIGIIPLIYWTFQKSNSEENKYGNIPEDINNGNFHRNIGITIQIIYVLLLGINSFSSFEKFKSWQLEEIGDATDKLKSINKLFLVENSKNSFIKLSYVCTSKKELGFVISPIYGNNNLEVPVEVVKNSGSIKIKNDKGVENTNNIDFSYIENNKNIVIAELNQSNLSDLFKTDTIEVLTKEGLWSSKVNFNSKEVINFVHDCTK